MNNIGSMDKPVKDVRFRAEDSKLIGVIMSTIGDKPDWWSRRFELAGYVDRCIQAGFCKTSDQMRLCALRYIDGKRKITPPGTKKKKTAEKKLAAVLKNVPRALSDAIDNVCKSKSADEYKNGNTKAINSMVGMVMKLHKYDAAIVKQLLINKLEDR